MNWFNPVGGTALKAMGKSLGVKGEGGGKEGETGVEKERQLIQIGCNISSNRV